MKISRRQFLVGAGTIASAKVLTGLGLYQYGRQVGAEELTVERIEIPVRNLQSGLEGFKIVQLSDLHVYPFTTAEFIQQAVNMANQLQPDLVVLTGDYITRDTEAIHEVVPVLTGLNARYGIFSVLGNHEIWTNGPYTRQVIEKTGIPVLVNQGVTLTVNKMPLYVAGVDDCWSGKPDLAAAMAEAPADAPTVLLAHEPDVADEFCKDPRVSVQLSGHTHGGQVRIPGYGAMVLPRYGKKYQQGLYQVEDMWLYTNRGVGVSPVSYRLNCPPEISEITLVGRA